MAGEMGSGSSGMECSGTSEFGNEGLDSTDSVAFDDDGSSIDLDDNGYQEASERQNDSTELPGNEADYNQETSDYQRAHESSWQDDPEDVNFDDCYGEESAEDAGSQETSGFEGEDVFEDCYGDDAGGYDAAQASNGSEDTGFDDCYGDDASSDGGEPHSETEGVRVLDRGSDTEFEETVYGGQSETDQPTTMEGEDAPAVEGDALEAESADAREEDTPADRADSDAEPVQAEDAGEARAESNAEPAEQAAKDNQTEIGNDEVAEANREVEANEAQPDQLRENQEAESDDALAEDRVLEPAEADSSIEAKPSDDLENGEADLERNTDTERALNPELERDDVGQSEDTDKPLANETERARAAEMDDREIGDAAAEGRLGDSDEAEISDQADRHLDAEAGVEKEPNGDKGSMENLKESVCERTKAFYEKARELAKENATLRFFTNHGIEHRNEVMEKTSRAFDAIGKAVKSGLLRAREGSQIAFTSNASEARAVVAAGYHDIGMSGENCIVKEEKTGKFKSLAEIAKRDGFDRESKKYGDYVRNNHSLNSALGVLRIQNSDALGGFDARDVAMECYAHSKSKSGVTKLADYGMWEKAAGDINQAAAAYERAFGGKLPRIELEKMDLNAVATETLALRMGDANRDSELDAIIHSGEPVTIGDRLDEPMSHVENEDPREQAREQEAEYYSVKTESGVEISRESKKFILGENNIGSSDISSSESGAIVNEISVNDANMAYNCTQASIFDRINEYASANSLEGAYSCRVSFPNGYSDEVKTKYNSWRVEYDPDNDYAITFPWDR